MYILMLKYYRAYLYFRTMLKSITAADLNKIDGPNLLLFLILEFIYLSLYIYI